MTMPMNEEVRKAVEYADGIFDGCDNGEWQTIRAELTRLTEIADAVDPLVIRLGEVTTELERLRDAIAHHRDQFPDEALDGEIALWSVLDAHLSENTHV